MKPWLILGLGLTALGSLLGGCDSPANTEKFISTAAAAGEFEIAASKLAVTKASIPDVKLFAQQMITDHEAAAEALKAAAMKAGRAAPTAGMDEEHARQVEELKTASGPAFDKLYVEQQLKAHEDAVALFTAYSKSAEGGPVKQFAEETLPTLEKHLTHVRGLNATPTT
jgi:putative membrane protein